VTVKQRVIIIPDQPVDERHAKGLQAVHVQSYSEYDDGEELGDDGGSN